MKKTKLDGVAVPKDQSRLCQRCGHRHIAKSGPCRMIGCGCQANAVALPALPKKGGC